MTDISPSQLRAARGLLNWMQSDLSKLSGISEPTIQRYEKGTHEPEVRTVNKLRDVFDRFGVEFLDNQGVRFKQSSVDVYDGLDRFDDFYDFLYDHLQELGGDVCVNIYDDTIPPLLRKDPDLHRQRMKRLFDKGKITFRVLTTISFFMPGGYTDYRWLPKQPATPTCFYSFGDCLALMSFVDIKSPHVVVLHSAALAEGYRQGFNVAWQSGQKPPPPSVVAKLVAKERWPVAPKDRC